MIKVLVVDDHALVRLGISKLLEGVSGIEVVGQAESGEEALIIARDKLPDVVLLDMNMPGIGGIETTKRLVRIHHNMRVIALTAFSGEPYPSRILQAGASGYLTKSTSYEEMILAIQRVMQGKKYLSSDVAQQMALSSLNDNSEDQNPFEQLSERELQVMLMITNGLKVNQISDKLCLSPKTVNSYRYRLFEKLKVNNDVELTLLAVRHSLLDKVGSESEEGQFLLESSTTAQVQEEDQK